MLSHVLMSKLAKNLFSTVIAEGYIGYMNGLAAKLDSTSINAQIPGEPPFSLPPWMKMGSSVWAHEGHTRSCVSIAMNISFGDLTIVDKLLIFNYLLLYVVIVA